MNDHDDDALKSLWKSQPRERLDLSLADIHRQASRFQRRVRVRNALEYAAGVIVLAGFGHYLALFPGPRIRTGCVLVMLATLFVLFQLHRRGSSRTPPGASLGVASLGFHRADLARQRDAVREVWLWYVAPFVPGVAVFRWGVETELADSPFFAHGMAANATIAVVFVVIALVNRWSARRLQRRLKQLDALAAEADTPSHDPNSHPVDRLS